MIYRPALPADAPALTAMATRCFIDTFGTLYRPQDLAEFLHGAFETNLPAHVADSRYTVQIAEDDGQIAGFAKLGPVDFPGDWGATTIELHQLYVLADWHGAGVARALMDWVIATARARGCTRLVLSVFVDNHRAKRFYARYGFRDVGRYDFRIGDHVDEDRLMSLDL